MKYTTHAIYRRRLIIFLLSREYKVIGKNNNDTGLISNNNLDLIMIFWPLLFQQADVIPCQFDVHTAANFAFHDHTIIRYFLNHHLGSPHTSPDRERRRLQSSS